MFMTQWKTFFSMTRHERMGAIAVLVMLIAVVATDLCVSRCTHSSPGRDSIATLTFERSMDSIQAVKDSLPVVRKRKASRDTTSRRKSSRQSQPRGGNGQHRQRSMDPIPAF